VTPFDFNISRYQVSPLLIPCRGCEINKAYLQESRAEEGVLYPEAQDFYDQSSKAWPEEGFKDLYRDDFIMAAGRVARRKLNRMETGPYQRALLCRGVTMKVDAEDEKVPVLQQAMEYTGAVGMMVMDELAYVHE